MATAESREAAARKVRQATSSLKALGFGPRQSNEMAGYVLLALLDLKPMTPWKQATAPLRGITPIIEFIAKCYGQRYAPNTRETVRDEAVKYFVELGLLLRNPDEAQRPTNSGKTAYQIEPTALTLFRALGRREWQRLLRDYLAGRETIRREIDRDRDFARVPVKLPDGTEVKLSPGDQNPLIKQIVEEFCPRFTTEPIVVYIGDTESKFHHLAGDHLARLGIVIDPAAKMPDVVVHDTRRNWLFLIEAVTSGGSIDGKRRKELKALFADSKAGLVFVTAFETREEMRRFFPQISWETEVWIAESPDHLLHFNGERLLGPYPDVAR